jgi:hypothetical protein
MCRKGRRGRRGRRSIWAYAYTSKVCILNGDASVWKAVRVCIRIMPLPAQSRDIKRLAFIHVHRFTSFCWLRLILDFIVFVLRELMAAPWQDIQGFFVGYVSVCTYVLDLKCREKYIPATVIRII